MLEQTQIPQQYITELAKLNELLRMYSVLKKQNKAAPPLTDRISTKCQQILTTLKRYSQFQQIEKDITNKIQKTLSQSKPTQTSNPKTAKSNNIQLQTDNQSNKKNSLPNITSIKSLQKPTQNQQLKNTVTVYQKFKKMPQVISPLISNPNNQSSLFSSTPNSNNQSLNIPRQAYNNSPKITAQNNAFLSANEVEISSIAMQQNSSNISINLDSADSFRSLQQNPPTKQLLRGSPKNIQNSFQSQPNKIDFDYPHHKSEDELSRFIPKDSPIQSQSESQQDKLSEPFSQQQNILDNIINFCQKNKHTLNHHIVFNDDLFTFIKQDEPDFLYLFGVNKPETRTIKKLYACTLMKFSLQQIHKAQGKFDKEIKDFTNSIRMPIGLIMLGQTPKVIQPEFVKFLINMQSPCPIILVLNNLKKIEGSLCAFHSALIDNIRSTPKKELSHCTEDLIKKMIELPFNNSNFSEEKTKYVITKVLNRSITTNAEQAPNAITVSDNECIRQQKHTFTYKLHTKFAVASRPDYCIYFVSNNCVNVRIGFKDFQQFKKQAFECQSKTAGIFSVTVLRENMPIRKQFFELLLECSQRRDPYIFINFSSLSAKKTIIVTLKKNVSVEMIQKMQPLQFKNYEKDTAITYCVHVLAKHNFKQFESEEKIDLIQVKPK